MAKESMRLFSWQGRSFDPRKHRRIPEKTGYFPNENSPQRKLLLDAYKELARRLATDQWIFCMKDKGTPEFDKVLWIMDVPKAGILAHIDEIAWNDLALNNKIYPKSLRWNCQQESINTRAAFGPLLARREAEYDAKRPKKEQLWNIMFLDDASNPEVQILVRLPLDTKWVIEPRECS